jgi:hypothetical protein
MQSYTLIQIKKEINHTQNLIYGTYIPFMELAFVWNMYQCKLFIGGHVEPICIYHEDKKN